MLFLVRKGAGHRAQQLPCMELQIGHDDVQLAARTQKLYPSREGTPSIVRIEVLDHMARVDLACAVVCNRPQVPCCGNDVGLRLWTYIDAEIAIPPHRSRTNVQF